MTNHLKNSLCDNCCLKNKCSTKKLKSYNCLTDFGYLKIGPTSITAIDAETFGNATFETILFRNNSMLTKIDPKAFSKSAEAETVQVLGIFDSPQYSDSEQVFELVNYLKVKSKVGFDNIGIKEIPDNAFKTDLKLSYLMLNENNIKRIGKSAFTPLTNLIQLAMIYNNVSEIDSNGLTFNLSNKSLKTNLTVFLNNNNLTENSFHENWANSKPGNRFVRFLINDNQIKKLPQKVFESVLLSPATEYLGVGGNPYVCDCDMKYLLTDKTKIADKLRNVVCANHSNKTLFNLETKDLGQC